MSIQPLKHLNSQKQQLIGRTLRFNSRKASTTSGLLASQNYLNAQKTTTNTNKQQVQGATQDDKQDNNWITWLLAALALIGGIALFAFSRKNGGFGEKTTNPVEDPATATGKTPDQKPPEINIDDKNEKDQTIPPPPPPSKFDFNPDTLPNELKSLFKVSIDEGTESLVLAPLEANKILKVEVKQSGGSLKEITAKESQYSIDLPVEGNRSFTTVNITLVDGDVHEYQLKRTPSSDEIIVTLSPVIEKEEQPEKPPRQELSLPSESHFTNSSLKQNSDDSFLFSSSFGLTSFQVQKPKETVFKNVQTKPSAAAYTYRLPALKEGEEALVKIKIGDKEHLYKFSNKEGVYAFESYIEVPKEPEVLLWTIDAPEGVSLPFELVSTEANSLGSTLRYAEDARLEFFNAQGIPISDIEFNGSPNQSASSNVSNPGSIIAVDKSQTPYTFFSLTPNPENRTIEAKVVEVTNDRIQDIKKKEIAEIEGKIDKAFDATRTRIEDIQNGSQPNKSGLYEELLEMLPMLENSSYKLTTGETWRFSEDKVLVEAVNELRGTVERLIEKENPNTKILEGFSSRIESLEGLEQFDKATFEQILADIHTFQSGLEMMDVDGQESSFTLVQKLLNIREAKLKAAFAPRLEEITQTLAAFENGQTEGEVDLNGLKQELKDHLSSLESGKVIAGSGKLEPEPIDPTIKSLLDKTNTLINQIKGLADISLDLPTPEKIGLRENIPFLANSLEALNNERAVWKLSVSGRDVITTQATTREGKTTYRVLSRQSDNHQSPFAEAGSISFERKSTNGAPSTLLITAINIKNAEINPEKFLLAQLLQREINKDEYPTILLETNLVKADESLANKLKPYGFVSTEKDGFITLPKAAFDGVWKNWLNNQLALKEIYSNDLSLPSDIPSENITQYVKPDFGPSNSVLLSDSSTWSLNQQDVQAAMNTIINARFTELSNELVFSQRQGDENRQRNSTDAAKIRSVLSHEILIQGLELLEKEYRKNPQKIYRENRDNSTPKVFGAAQSKEFQETIYDSTLAALNSLNINGVDFTSEAYTSLLKNSIQESTSFLERVLANNLIGANPEVHFRTIEKRTPFSDSLHEGLDHEYSDLTRLKNKPISFTVFPEVYTVSSNGTKQQLIKAKVSISQEDKETQ